MRVHLDEMDEMNETADGEFSELRGFITNVPAPPAREQGIIAPRLGATPILSITSSMNRYAPEPL